MTSFTPVAIAWSLQLLFGVTLFLHPEGSCESPAAPFASWIFLSGLLDFVMDFELYPVCYMHLPDIVRILWETLCVLLIAEVGNLIVWCEIENILGSLTEVLVLSLGASNNFYKDWEKVLVSGVTMLAAGAFFLAALYATDDLYFLQKKCSKVMRCFYLKYDAMFRKMCGRQRCVTFCEPNPCQCRKNRRQAHCNFCDCQECS